MAFALAGLGARVTSVDISQAQLDVAAERARDNGLDIEFVRADVCELGLADATFDAVYTGGHVAVWVADLFRYYAEATRILREGGLFLVREYHPFRRLWRADPDRLVLEHGYFSRGPHTYLPVHQRPPRRPTGRLPPTRVHVDHRRLPARDDACR